jgi:DNA-binding Lrp family transcriptional regulator
MRKVVVAVAMTSTAASQRACSAEWPCRKLATATGLSPATAARRLADLHGRGAIFFDIEIKAARYGVTTQAFLWMAVAPAELDQVATTLATHDELAVVAATTGPTNLIAHALCPDPAALHRYLTHRLGALPADRRGSRARRSPSTSG